MLPSVASLPAGARGSVPGLRPLLDPCAAPAGLASIERQTGLSLSPLESDPFQPEHLKTHLRGLDLGFQL